MDEAVLFHTKIRIHKLVVIFAYVILLYNDVTKQVLYSISDIF